jgi:hypothetical protein
MCRVNHGQSIFKELAKELHQDPAVLSGGLGKLAEELASKPELRHVMEMLYDTLKKGRQRKKSIGFPDPEIAPPPRFRLTPSLIVRIFDER